MITASKRSFLDILTNSSHINSSRISHLNTSSPLPGCLAFLYTLKVTTSSATLKSTTHCSTSIKALPVAKNGLPRISGTLSSSSISRITNQQGKQIYQLLLKHPHRFHRV